MNHPQHPNPMKLNRDDKKTFECSGCKELGFGPRYQSEKNCHFVLHEVCFNARPTDRPRIHPFMSTNCRFKFLWTAPAGPNRRLCHACEREIRGFLYRVRSSNRWIYLHPCCMNPESTISDPYNMMKLILKDKVPSDCLKCERKDLKGPLRGWSYVSSCGNYCYHVYCMKKLILDIWERGYFSVPSSSSPSFSSSSWSSSSSRGKSLVRVETASSSRIMMTSATSSLALPTRPWWKPRILSATEDVICM